MVALTRLPLPRLLHRFDAWWSGRVWVPRIHRAQQGRLIQERVATLARMLAALVVGWVPLDLYALRWEELVRVLPLRLLLAVALLAARLVRHPLVAGEKSTAPTEMIGLVRRNERRA